MKSKSNRQPSRREILRILAGLGITGPAALELMAQAKKKVSPEILKSANAGNCSSESRPSRSRKVLVVEKSVGLPGECSCPLSSM